MARHAHRGQERKDPGSPYVVHPVLVAERLVRHGYSDEVLAAALLHDVVERSDVTIEDLATRFGWTVADLVASLTDDPTIEDFSDRKDALRSEVARAGEEVKAIYAADRTSNARELARVINALGELAAMRDPVPPETRLRLWQDDVRMLDATAPCLVLLHELRPAIRDLALAVACMQFTAAATS